MEEKLASVKDTTVFKIKTCYIPFYVVLALSGFRVKCLNWKQWSASFCLCIFSGFDMYFWRLPFVLFSAIILIPFLHMSLLYGWNACYPGGGGTSAPCSTGIAWAGRGISKAVAWHAPRVLPLWWCPNGVPGLMLASMVKVGYALRVPLTLHGLALLYLKR